MGNGPFVLCLHGWGGSTKSFLGVAKELSSFYTVILVDFNGFGRSPEPDRPYTLDDYVQSVLDIVRYYKMESLSLICHSFGGRVGIKFCYKYGYLIDKLVLADVAGMRPRRHIRYYFSVFRHKLLKKLHIPHVSGSRDYRTLSPVMKKTFVSIVNEHLEKYAEYIKVPTLLFWGNKDRDTPVYMGKRLLRLISGSQMIVVKGCGHFAYLERHNVFVRAASVFLSGDVHETNSGKRGSCFRRRNIVTIPDPLAKQ